METRTCLFCGKPFGPERHGNATYCSLECSYAAKKIRSVETYAAIIWQHQIRSKNLSILEAIWHADLKEVGFDILDELGFDYGYADREVKHEDGSRWKVIGGLFYRKNENKTITVWNVNLHQ